MATTPSVAEKTRNATSVGDNWTYSNEGSRKNEYSNSMATAEDRVGVTQPLCNGSRQEKELLCLWRIWAHELTLQE